MKICNVCKTVLDDSAIYCPRCTSQSFSAFPTKQCPFCNALIAIGTIVCTNCHKILPPEDYVSSANQNTMTAQPFYGGNRQGAGNEFAVPKLNQGERLVQVLPNERLENIAFDSVAHDGGNTNFGRPEQYATNPNAGQTPIQNGQASFEQNPINDKHAKEVGFSKSSARLNEKINAKIAKKNKLSKKKKWEETEMMFEEKNKKYNDGAVGQSEAETYQIDQLGENAYADLNQQQRIVHKNEGSTQTFIYNQMYPTPQSNNQNSAMGQPSQGYSMAQMNQQPVGMQSPQGRANNSRNRKAKGRRTTNVSRVKSYRKSGGGAAAALCSIIFLIAGLAASLLLTDINFLNDKISGLQLLVAYLPSQISSLFPSDLLKIINNGFLLGKELALFKIVPYIYMGAVGVTALSILSHLFCFRATSGRGAYLAILGIVSLILSMSILAAIYVLFNFSTIGYGLMFLAGGIILSLLSLAIGYRKKKKMVRVG